MRSWSWSPCSAMPARIAEAIASGLSAQIDVRLVDVAEAPTRSL